MNCGIVEIDIHEMNCCQAKIYIDSTLKKAGKDVYRIRVIHGYHRGTVLRDMVRSYYRKCSPKVLRVEIGLNQGETELVLKELF